jgi:hypothetical protein
MPDFLDHPDCLNLSTVLRKSAANRVFFDPSRESHLESFRTFLHTGNWGELQFYCEHPYTDVPMTVLMKAAMYTEGVQRETNAEQQQRLAVMNLTHYVPETAEAKAARIEATNISMGFKPRKVKSDVASPADLAGLS